MTNLDIKINIKRLSNYSASLKTDVGEETLLLMIESFANYIKELYVSVIKDATNSSRYRGNWEPVDDKNYHEYLGTIPEFNILDLVSDALEVRRVGYNLIVRIDPKYKYPGSKLTLLRVLRAIEHGTSDFHARPLLEKSRRSIQSSILRLWRGFLYMKGVIG